MDLVDPSARRYALDHTSAPIAEIAALRAETEASTSVPQMAGGLVESRLLEALVVATRARRVLEIGMFTGVTALSMASRMPEDGVVVTLEADPDVAEIARRHFEASQYGTRIQLVEGDARETVTAVEGPFDVVFIDAWKSDYPHYYETVLPKLAAHGVIVADNVLRRGTVLDETDESDDARILRAFAEDVQADPRVDNALLTVGDGLMLIWKRAAT